MFTCSFVGVAVWRGLHLDIVGCGDSARSSCFFSRTNGDSILWLARSCPVHSVSLEPVEEMRPSSLVRELLLLGACSAFATLYSIPAVLVLLAAAPPSDSSTACMGCTHSQSLLNDNSDECLLKLINFPMAEVPKDCQISFPPPGHLLLRRHRISPDPAVGRDSREIWHTPPSLRRTPCSILPHCSLSLWYFLRRFRMTKMYHPERAGYPPSFGDIDPYVAP